MRERFALLGERWITDMQHRELRVETEAARQAAAEAQARTEAANRGAAEAKEGRSTLEAQVISLTHQVALLEGARAGLEQELAELRDKSARDEDALRNQSDIVHAQLAAATKARAEADRSAKDLNAQLAAATSARADDGIIALDH